MIPEGTITGLQVVKAPGYLAFGGWFDQVSFSLCAR